jgi:lipoprotein NlpD
MKFKCRVALVIILLGFGLISGCSGWKPTPGDSKVKSTYSQTPDGYYRVRQGDTLHAIAFKFGMDWQNIATWNDIRSPYIIHPDQQLRLIAPAARAAAGSQAVVTAAAPSRSSSSSTYDVPPNPETAATTATAVESPVATEPAPAETTASPGPSPMVTPPSPPNVDNPAKWLWPSDGRIISNFAPNDAARKGIDIGGTEGQAVVASAAGEVVYSGSGLIGYGELVIIKHNEQLLSAYAHNQQRLVAEGQQVAAGERIANMGKNDRNQAMLHFEIRLNGNPQDPLKYLPRH